MNKEEKEISILLLEKRGCDFWESDEEMNKYSDVGNYRVFCKGLTIEGITTFFDFGRTYKRIFQIDRKGNIKGYKNIHQHLLGATMYQVDDKGNEWGNRKIEKMINDLQYNYTLEGILKAVNKVNSFHIEKILIFDRIYDKIEDIAGYREKNILSNCCKICEIMNTKEHHVLKFYNLQNNYFEYDIITNKITG